MASNKTVILGPLNLTNVTTTNIWSPPTLTGGTGVPPTSTNSFYLIRHVRIVNTDTTARTFTLYKDATGGNTSGKQIIGSGYSVAANSSFDWFGSLRLSAGETDKFIVGGASVTNVMTIQAEAEMGIE